MREIKVRVWYEAESKYYYFSLEEYMLSNEERQSELCPSYIGLQSEQYTGLRDKNGREIYEGDILFDERFNRPFAVEWEDGGDGIYIWHGYTISERHVTVIGNIHENPELLK